MSSLPASSSSTTVPNTSPNQPVAPRKRRRRAPATGATEDCFTCRKRQAKCDRRRPYCTQCIELGKECSGYRTTLTWGVGVASRGKLRGMSLPVPKSPASPPTSATRERAQSMSHASRCAPQQHQHRQQQHHQHQQQHHHQHQHQHHHQPAAPSPPSTAPYEAARRSSRVSDVKSPSPIRSPPVHDYPSLDATSPIQIPPPAPQHLGWHLPGFGEHMDGYGGPSSRKPRPQLPVKPLHKLHTSLAGSYDDTGLSTSTGPLSSYSDSVLGDYPSPSEFPGTPDDFSFADPMIHSYNEHYIHQRTPMSSSTESLVFHDAPRSYPMICEDLSSSISSDQSLQDFSEMSSMHPASYSHSGFSDMFFPGGLGAAAGPNIAHIPGYSYSRGSKQPPPEPIRESHGSSSEAGAPPTHVELAPCPLAPPPPPRRLSPRMQFLLDYYDKAICSVLVAFDGPSNPYRMHVIPLAFESEGLQNAIAALSINNIRMRQSTEAKFLALSKGQRISNSALLPEWVYSRLTAEEIREMHGEPSAEEIHYKTTSIQLLNKQLADPQHAKDDSVLATLLILCLFHVCDSGFSKFRTQLAGVQKLLSMRDRSMQSGFIGWIEMFFTWFDVMTSTVNDRETQIKGDALDMVDLSTNLGALEHLAGCEGRLFKLIARLGRLNLLSQNRPVSSRSDDTPRPSPAYNRRGTDYYSIQGYDRLDGNGWGSPMAQHQNNPLDLLDADQRHEFWSEWRDIRERLQQWELEPANSAGPGPTMCDAGAYAMPPGQRDLLHISESFRYSALLYTERLANPALPSSSLNFQNLVAQALFHISQIGITSCVNKFLLWPLFITGTECVDESHRALVRQRCIEIQRESGFFNNLSGLEVLERTWREDDAGRNDEIEAEVARLGVGRQAFRWRKAMDRMDGEYILI